METYLTIKKMKKIVIIDVDTFKSKVGLRLTDADKEFVMIKLQQKSENPFLLVFSYSELLLNFLEAFQINYYIERK